LKEHHLRELLAGFTEGTASATAEAIAGGARFIRPGDLMGTSEVAEYLSWTTGQVTDYAKKGAAGIPAPFVHLKGGRIWLRQDIEPWAAARGYRGTKEG